MRRVLPDAKQLLTGVPPAGAGATGSFTEEKRHDAFALAQGLGVGGSMGAG